MLNEIKQLVNNINSKVLEMKNVTDEVVKLDEKRLEVIVNSALSGLSFDKVWSSKIGHTTGKDAAATYEYLKKDEKYLKGLKVGQYRGENFREDEYCTYEDTYELWLSANGFFVTHMTGVKRADEWGQVELTRELRQLDADPLEVRMDSNEYYWDVDIVVSSIISALNTRADDLSYRLVKQKDRLEKLKSLQI